MHKNKIFSGLCICSLIFLVSCSRDEIQFEGDPPNSYTKILRIDTITPVLSTVVLDSFITSSPSAFLLGGFNDTYLGIISARPFVQMSVPADATIPENAQFDSLVLVLPLNDYYYGDTTVPVTVVVHELDAEITYSYNDKLYNTSNVPVKSSPLGSRQVLIKPQADDSVQIRLNDTKGLELFNKLKQEVDEVTDQESFLDYFRGISVSISGTGSAVYGLKAETGAIKMRLHYHLTVPYPEAQEKDFTSLANDLAFNQVLADRSGTLLPVTGSGVEEFFSSETGNMAFTQPGTGVLLKTIFPSLRSLLSSELPVNLLHAELIIRPVSNSFGLYPLPAQVYLAHTDASNNIGSVLADSTGSDILYGYPVIDYLYGINTYYRFNLTGYIYQLLNTAGSQETGFYILEANPGQPTQVNRAVFGDALHPANKVELVLSVLTINNTN